MDTRFRLLDVSKTYRNRLGGGRAASVAALSGVNLAMGEHQVNALVGRSGAGKSTLSRIVMGMEVPDSGRVLFRERPLAMVPRRLFCRQNQMVFQNPYLAVNPLFTVRQIIAEPLRLAGMPAFACAEKTSELLELVELPETYQDRLPHELSGGELQRVALARALAVEPEFLVLDEPFSALDDLTAWRLLLQFRKIFRRLGLGILLVSHNPKHVGALADRVLVLERGRFVVGASSMSRL